jgi:fibronectin-binding autotransporter adhesin
MAGNYVLLETIELTQSAASVTFDNIPQSGYTDLKIVASTRNDAAAVQVVNTLKLGSIVTGYADKYLYGSGSAAGSGSFSATSGFIGDAPGASATASTFGNQEIYIPNYLSSNAKSWSVDSVAENNATGAFMELTAVSNTSTAAISSVTIAPTSGNFVANSTFSLYGVADVNTTPVTAPLATGGNIVANDGTYWYHAFLSSGTFTPQTDLSSADVLVVAGGGGGAAQNGGGGGAGGLRLLSSQSFTLSTNYTCTIGAGATATTPGGNIGLQGSNSSVSGTGLTTINATGGGGGSTGSTSPTTGGSGGGGGAQTASSSTPGVSGAAGNAGGYSPVEGYAGGQGWGVYSGGGGGGAGQVGYTATSSSGGWGGNGATSATINAIGAATFTGQLSGGNYYYAGGGGGATGYSSGTSRSSGGLGGGGLGGVFDSTTNPTAGTANTGGGGGGQPYGLNPTAGGGSGIVIIRYPV